jgi:hypothetical protein
MAGQYRSSADLITEALANLGVLGAGQPVDPEDLSYVQEKLDAIMRKLAALEIVSVADINTIPGAWFSDLADIVAGECANKFGATSEDVAKLTQKGLGHPPGSGAAALSLKQMMRGRPTGEILTVDYL